MALIVDPDFLTDGQEIVIVPDDHTIELKKRVSAEVQIDVVASAKTFTRLSGSFTTDGFVAGGYVTFSGFTNSGNNQTKIIDTITGSGTIITVTSSSGLVDETGSGDEKTTGALTDDGVTIKCVYSKLKELWKSNETYIKYAFPMTPITDEQFEVNCYTGSAWDWKDDTTRYLLRTGGWALKDSSGTSLEEWTGIVSLGALDSNDQVYFCQSSDGATWQTATNIQLAGAVNQAVKVYGDVTHGDFNYRGYLRLFCRTWQKSYAFAELSDIGVTTLSYQAYRFPLTNSADIKVTHTEVYVNANIPYTGMTITWYAAAQQRSIGGVNRDFHAIIDGNQGTAEEIYEFLCAQLRKATDIDEGSATKLGKVTQGLLHFVGDTLYSEYYPDAVAGGTFIDDYKSADINRLVFVDDTQTERSFPYTAAITISFGDNLKNDAQAKYWVYFTDVPSGNYGDDDAILVNEAEEIATTQRARASNVATITTGSVHNLLVGDGFVISGLGGSGYNGTWIVTVVTDTTHFSYACTGGDEGQTGDTNGIVISNMSGKVSGGSSIQKTFAYTTNAQGGRTPDSEAPITAVAIGLATGQFVKGTTTLQKATTNSVSLVAPLERNYQNPT